MNIDEIDEFNKFLGESPLRNGFLPIVHHISLLKPEQWEITEYEDVNGRTSSVAATISTGDYKDEDRITVKIHYDTFPKHEGEIIYEMAWGEENYCLASPTNPPEMQINRVKNMLTMLIKGIGYKDFNCDMKEYRKAQRGEYLLPI
jgi:hypothetical protein